MIALVATLMASCVVMAVGSQNMTRDELVFLQMPGGRSAVREPVAQQAWQVRQPQSDRLSSGQATAAPAVGLVVCAVSICAAALRSNNKASSQQQQQPRVVRNALSEIGSVKLNLQAGKATPAPPVGPALGQFGANIAFFVKEYNAMTSDRIGNIVPVIVHVFSDRSFKLELKTPPTAALLYKACGKQKGSGKAGIEIIGSITLEQLREIATLKLSDLNCEDIERAMKIIHGTAVAAGITVDGYEEWLATEAVPKPESIMTRYGPGVARLPKKEEVPAEA